MLRFLKISLPLCVLLVCVVCNGFAQSASQSPISGPRNRVTGVLVDAEVVTLSGNTHPMARAEFDRGEVARATRLDRMVLVLKPDAQQQRALDALTEAQQEPGSLEYHQWLTPEEYGQRFGVSAADLARISDWLQGHGFTVEAIPAGRRAIVFSGTAGRVADTFHAQMHRFVVGGAAHIANIEDPQIPEALSPVVQGILSLHDFRRVSATRAVRAVAKPENTQGSAHYMFPADFAAIYNLNPLYAAGQNGSGGSIAIVGRSNINLNDVATFRSTSGLAAKAPTVILVGANPGLVAGDQDEATLDVEWSGAVAAGAAVKYVAARSTGTSDGVDLSAQYIVNNKIAPVMSTSFGSCEANMGSSELAFYNSLWQQAASEGISSFVSSGDSGAAGCSSGSSTSGSRAAVNGLCSSPYATCVGGTEFNEGSGAYWNATNGSGGESARGYIPEKVWNESASSGGSGLWASGGGISGTYAQPSWQRGVSGANSNGMRAVPDVALTAASHDGYLVCLNGNWYVFAGTSASSPSFAGIMAVLEQKLALAGQGNANPILYGLLNASTNPFHATPGGNNSVPGVVGFTAAGAAYNLATGLGSVDANLLVSNWPVSGGTTTAHPGFTLTPSTAALTVVSGKTATFTVAVAGTGGFTGSVALTAAAPSGVSVTFSPATVKAGASATATVVVSKTAAVGASTISLTGTSAGLSSKTQVALRVGGVPTVTLSLSSPRINMSSTATQQVTVTLTPAGGLTPAANLSGVSFQVTGMPTGITAQWGAPSLTASGSVQAVLMLVGSKNAVASSTQLTFTGRMTDAVTGVTYASSVQTGLVVTRSVLRKRL